MHPQLKKDKENINAILIHTVRVAEKYFLRNRIPLHPENLFPISQTIIFLRTALVRMKRWIFLKPTMRIKSIILPVCVILVLSCRNIQV